MRELRDTLQSALGGARPGARPGARYGPAHPGEPAPGSSAVR